MYFGYRAPLAEFLVDDTDSIIGKLHRTIAEDGFSRIWNTQTAAWQEELQYLRRTFREIVATNKASSSWTLFLSTKSRAVGVGLTL